MKKAICLLTSLFVLSHNFPQEFLYPTATITHEDIEKICVLYQKDEHLELWLWDPETRIAVKGLLSSYIPAGLRVLPQKNAFSFIDNDRIRIKHLAKRSPKTIDLPYGPYDFSTIEWINQDHFYFSARERGYLNLFYASVGGELARLTTSTTTEYLYPQKVDDELYFVSKDESSCKIEKMAYPLKLVEKHQAELDQTKSFKDKVRLILKEEEGTDYKAYMDVSQAQELYCCKKEQTDIAFLSMTSSDEGFFLTHPSIVHRQDTHLTLSCHHLKNKEDLWTSAHLFDFSIPLHLLMVHHNRGDRLYESILPLLPLYRNDTIYFSSDADGTGLRLFCYNRKTKQKKQVTCVEGFCDIFSPFCHQNRIYYGGSVCHTDDRCFGPTMWIGQEGIQRFEFPYFEE